MFLGKTTIFLPKVDSSVKSYFSRQKNGFSFTKTQLFQKMEGWWEDCLSKPLFNAFNILVEKYCIGFSPTLRGFCKVDVDEDIAVSSHSGYNVGVSRQPFAEVDMVSAHATEASTGHDFVQLVQVRSVNDIRRSLSHRCQVRINALKKVAFLSNQIYIRRLTDCVLPVWCDLDLLWWAMPRQRAFERERSVACHWARRRFWRLEMWNLVASLFWAQLQRQLGR